MRDLERERADDALRRVQALDGQDRDARSRYRSYVDRFGGAVVMNGLGQALATELAAAGGDERYRAHATLANNVSEWLLSRGILAGVADTDSEPARRVLAAITTGTQHVYVWAQAEALAWLTWHKKFCHAFLPKPEGNQE